MVAEPVRFVVWGSAGHAKVLHDVIAAHHGQVLALVDNNPDAAPSLPGIPLLHGEAGLDQWLSQQSSIDGMQVALAIGGARGEERYRLAHRLRAKGLSLPSLVHSTSSVSPSALLGQGCQVLAQTVVAADVRMGEVCIVNNRASIDHECELGHGVHIAPGATVCGCVSIGDYTMVGAGAVILPRLRIGGHVVIGAGAVVTRDIPDGWTVMGNPARPRAADL